jgi:predicted N-acetyltransferase YhbS
MRRIEVLNRNHDRAGFDCGVVELNRYLKRIARQHLEKGISRTFVLVDDSKPAEILGFFTLAACEVRSEVLPEEFAKKYPRNVPVTKLARLAVAKRSQYQGLGSHMIMNAMERVVAVSKNLGFVGFFVDAKDENVGEYYKRFGFIPLPDTPLKLFLPLKTIYKACFEE